MSLLHRSPVPSVLYAAYTLVADPITLGYGWHRFSTAKPLPNDRDIGLLEDRGRMPLPHSLPVPGYLVRIVIRVCPKEKVLLINANRIITSVTDNEAIRDWAVNSLPCVPMSLCGPSSPLHSRVAIFVNDITPFNTAILMRLEMVEERAFPTAEIFRRTPWGEEISAMPARLIGVYPVRKRPAFSHEHPLDVGTANVN